MYLKKLYLLHFRNYDNLLLTLHNGINIIYGENAQGKTNLLESIYVLAMTKSHRSFIDNNLIQNGSSYSQIKGQLHQDDIDNTYEVIIENKKKSIKINDNTIKSVSDYISNINIIIFYPDDLDLIKSSPLIRRRFINSELGQLDGKYLNILSDYNKILKMRNDYIKLINQGESYDENYFNIITDYYIDKSIKLYQERYNFINLLNEQVEKIFKNISGLSNFHILYKNSFDFDSYDDADKMRIQMKNKIKNSYATEIRLKSTLFGPHKDDLEFYIDTKEVKNYGSQGQQRMAVLAIKLSEIEIFKNKTGNYPILLLDDVFSELDYMKKNNLLSYIRDNVQTIITTTELDNISPEIKRHAKLIEINSGKIKNIKEVN